MILNNKYVLGFLEKIGFSETTTSLQKSSMLAYFENEDMVVVISSYETEKIILVKNGLSRIECDFHGDLLELERILLLAGVLGRCGYEVSPPSYFYQIIAFIDYQSFEPHVMKALRKENNLFGKTYVNSAIVGRILENLQTQISLIYKDYYVKETLICTLIGGFVELLGLINFIEGRTLFNGLEFKDLDGFSKRKLLSFEWRTLIIANF